MIRCVVIGTVLFTAHCLEALTDDPRRNEIYTVVGIVTAVTDNLRNSDNVDLALHAARLGCPLLRTATTRGPAVLDAIAAWRPDLILVLGWSQLLDDRLLSLPRLGCIGSHPAPLPRGRGRHPLVWSMVLGWPGTMTLFQLETGADTGPIWSQRPFRIDPNDHASEAYTTMSRIGAGMVVDLLRDLASGTVTAVPQDHTQATVLRKRSPDDGILRFDRQAAECHALIRALARPYPGALAMSPAGEITCWRVAPLEHGRPVDGLPGTVVASGGGRIEISCADRTLIVTEISGPQPTIGERCRWPQTPLQSPYGSPA